MFINIFDLEECDPGDLHERSPAAGGDHHRRHRARRNCRGEYARLIFRQSPSDGSAVEMSSSVLSPLAGCRVLDLTRIVAGPFCTMLLGDLGAEVIKVEHPDGDEARRWGPPFVGDSNESCYFMSLNRNKKSVCVDLKRPKGGAAPRRGTVFMRRCK